VTPERWAQIEELFHRAAESDPQHRAAVLDDACGEDSDLRAQIEALLSSDQSARSQMQNAVRSEFESVAFSLTGTTVSHYRILGGIGGGGMGLVYEAEDIRLGRRVAIKFLPEDSTKDAEALRRFECEARSASALEHPNICPIYEFGEHEGQPFLVMQLLEGQTLRELIAAAEPSKSPVEIRKLLDIAIQISAGLDAAHKQGIIHRDIKPANIFVTASGEVKILDFGLAKLVRDAETTGPELNTDRLPASLFLSRTGVTVGTVAYMSPEQIRGDKLDPRTDLFSLGLVLYEMATGHRAIVEDSAAEIHHPLVQRTPISIRSLNPQLPPQLEIIIAKALEKDRELRYQSASEIRSALEAFRHRRLIKPRWTWKGVAVGGLLALLAVTSATFWSARRPSVSQPIANRLKQRQLTVSTSENQVTAGQISPDGKYLAYTDRDGIHLKLTKSGETGTVTSPNIFEGKSLTWELGPWLPDSTRFLAVAELPQQPVSMWMLSAAGGIPYKLRDDAAPWSVSPDGTLIAFGTGDLHDIWIMGTDGGHSRKLEDGGRDTMFRAAQWSPEGKRLAFIRTFVVAGKAQSEIQVRDINSGSITTVIAAAALRDVSQLDTGLQDMSWLPDGRLIWVGGEPDIHGYSCNLWEALIDFHTGKLILGPSRLTDWAGFCVTTFSRTADGKKLVFTRSSELLSVYMADFNRLRLHLGEPKRLTLTDDLSSPTGWMPNGAAVFIRSNREGSWGIYTQSLSGGTARPILAGQPNISWSTSVTSDHRWLLYEIEDASDGVTSVRTMRIPLKGGPPEEVVRSASHESRCPQLRTSDCVVGEPTPDGKRLAFFVLDPLHGRGRELASFRNEHAAEFAWDLSPDGTRVVLFRQFESRFQVLSLNQPALIREISVKGGAQLRTMSWAADGKGLFASSAFPLGAELIYVDLSGSAHRLWRVNGWNASLWARPSPDGRKLAILGSAGTSNVWMMENF
jgi:serine/threonine protein kinase/Tol biopolymer transport system component